jgi:hypothetical protein
MDIRRVAANRGAKFSDLDVALIAPTRRGIALKEIGLFPSDNRSA